MIQAFILDIDGTLIDSVKAHAESWVKTFKKYGKQISLEEAEKLIGMGGDQFLSDYFSKKELDEKQEEIEEYRSNLFKKKFLPDVEAFPKAKEFVEKILSDGKKVVLASSAKEDEVENYKKLLKIEDLIEKETSTDDAEESKPEPDIFNAARKKIKDVKNENILIIGDTPYDAEAASKANLKIIGVLTGGWSKEKLENNGCVKVYKDIEEIYENYEQVINL